MKINWHWIAAVVFDWTILLLGIYLSYISLWFIPISMLIVGNRQHALGILGHDGAHRHVAKNRKLNDVITNFATMYPLGINLENYRKFHWDHHKFNGIKGKDPELPIKNIGPFAMKQKYSKRELYRDLCFDLLGFGVAQLLGFIIQVRPKTALDSSCLLFMNTTLMAPTRRAATPKIIKAARHDKSWVNNAPIAGLVIIPSVNPA